MASAEASAPRRSVQIAGETSSRLSWSASISRVGGREGEGAKGRRRPCLSVDGARRAKNSPGVASSLTLCAGYPSLAADREPLIVEGGEATRRRAIESKLTVVAIALAPRVTRVDLTNFDGATTTHEAFALTPRQATRTRLARLRYVAFAVAGPYCVDRIVTYGTDGGRLWESGAPGRCPSGEFPPVRR